MKLETVRSVRAVLVLAMLMAGCNSDAGRVPLPSPSSGRPEHVEGQSGPGDASVIDSNVVPNQQGPASDLLVNKVWRVTSPNRAPGTFFAFLANGTLIMTSCVETYRLATWRAEAPTRLEITEDPTVTYGADVLTLDETRLNLRLNLKSEQVNLELATPQVPFVCPDLPR
jgi:hypothetical protein